jgi:xanthine/uracil permease
MPIWVQNILSSPVTVGGFSAIILSLLIPTTDTVGSGETSK